MERAYNFSIGQEVKMTPFIYTNDLVYGKIVDKTSISVFIKWDDIKDPMEHFQNEYRDLQIVSKTIKK